MIPRQPGRPHHGESALLALAALLTLAGYLAAAAAYFAAPTRFTLPLEVLLYQIPGIQHARMTGAALVALCWGGGCLLLLRRAWQLRKIPFAGTALAALTPALALALNHTFLLAARHIPPLSLRW